jgi:N-hydroxyarylamine O-acetyltransferase
MSLAPLGVLLGADVMADEQFDIGAWFSRIGYDGSREPTLENLRAVVTAHATAIAYESIDVLLDKPPSLNPASLQSKIIFGGRGGYCFEQNMLFRVGLLSLGYKLTSLQARVVRGLEVDAPRPMLHMVLRVDLPEGSFLADVGFGNLAPTTALKLFTDEEQETPHEIMRFITMGDELVLSPSWGIDGSTSIGWSCCPGLMLNMRFVTGLRPVIHRAHTSIT